MMQYTIKPLRWDGNTSCQIEDYYFQITTNLNGFYWLTVNDGVDSKDLECHTIEAAKVRAQSIWEDYLKQHLEQAKVYVCNIEDHNLCVRLGGKCEVCKESWYREY